jgi:hypothetical protein
MHIIRTGFAFLAAEGTHETTRAWADQRRDAFAVEEVACNQSSARRALVDDQTCKHADMDPTYRKSN